jgi:hypothetical protein
VFVLGRPFQPTKAGARPIKHLSSRLRSYSQTFD